MAVANGHFCHSAEYK